MRAGACTIQQALTAEAAAILKHSLNLARRRGHAQVTPLHVAATLLNSSCSASSLLRRACVRSHPHHPTSLPLQCRALELCFNVALNRLPTCSPPSSSSPLLRSHPSLSNALIAALKRAQAHQRRGCIEIQNNISQQQSNQPLLAIKVELEQLIISILDDPSVSRVMREAGFSSTSVKHNLEEDSAGSFGIAPCAKPLPFFDSGGLLFPMKQVEKKEGDVRVVLEMMTTRKRYGNTVVVGDSASIAEGVADELLMRVERGDVPEELRGAQVIKLQLSYIHLRLMNRMDVEMKISDLRRRIFSSLEKVVVVYTGDLRWVVGEEDRDGMASADYFISEFGRFLSELKSGINGGGRGRIQVLAFSSYQTYMRCKLMNPSLESQWALQAVVFPSGGLALSLHAPCNGGDSAGPKLKQYEFQRPKQNTDCDGDEVENACCGECISNYEKEAASALKFVTTEAITVNSKLPCWLRNTKPEKLYRDNLFELRRKWSRLCRNLHHSRIRCQARAQVHPTPISNAYPWWSNSLPSTKRDISMESSSISPESHAKSSRRTIATTTLALCSPVFADSAASTDTKMELLPASPRVLTKKLQENIPWQSPETMRLVADSLMDCRSKKGNWILIHGNDLIAKRRLARVVADSLGSTLGVLNIKLSKSSCGSIDLLAESLEKECKSVILMEGIECADPEFIKQIKDGIKAGFLMNSCGREIRLANLIFILTSSASKVEEDSNKVIRMRMRTEDEEHPSFSDEKRKSDSQWNPTGAKMKKLRTDDGGTLDLNVAVVGDGEGEEEGAVSGLTHEVDAGCEEDHLPPTAIFNFETNTDTMDRIAEGFTTKLRRVFAEMVGGIGGEGRLVVDRELAGELAAASGFFLEVEFDRWVSEVFKICVLTVKKGGKVRLGMEGKEGNLEGLGYLGSPLPKEIIVS